MERGELPFKEIEISKEEILITEEYARNSVNNYKNNGRSETEIFYDIFHGKLAEIAYAKYRKSLGDIVEGPDFTIRDTPDPGYDLTINNSETHNVKSLVLEDLQKKSRVFINYNYDMGKSQMYSLIYISRSSDYRKAFYVGSIPFNMINYKNLPRYEGKTYILRNEFEKQNLN